VVCTGEAAGQASEAVAGPSTNAAAAAAAPAAEEEGDSIDPEFLAALPPEIQAEVLEQQRRERRMRERQRQQQQAAAAAAQVSVKPLNAMASLAHATSPPVGGVCMHGTSALPGAGQKQLQQMTDSYSIRARGHSTHLVQ